MARPPDSATKRARFTAGDIGNGHLSEMAEQARDALEAEEIEVLADEGYFDSEEIAVCEDAGIDGALHTCGG